MSNIEFRYVERDRPIVLTAKDIAALSALKGQDVSKEVRALSNLGLPLKTKGALIRYLRAVLGV